MKHGYVIASLMAMLLAGCGEYKQQVEYTDGGYQGKRDTRMWDSEYFMHDRSVWKQMINERTQRQNEYVRTGEQR
jgi:major membrane immunogen (membrane-anchored lipoprotein)